MEGKKYDSGKADYSLIPVEALEGIARVFTYGAEKYARDNWKHVTPYVRYYSAAMRHLVEWKKADEIGEMSLSLDTESGLNHLDHAIVSLIMLRQLYLGPQKTDTPYEANQGPPGGG